MRKILCAALVLCTIAAAAWSKVKVPMPRDEFLTHCASGKLADVKRGVRSNVDVNLVDELGRSPLLCAAREQDNPGVIAFLIAKGAEVDKPNEQGLTPLMIAAMHNPRVKITQALLRRKADPRAVDGTGSTATLWAARHSRSEAVLTALLDAAPDTLEQASAAGQTPLMAAAQNERIEMARLLIDRGARADAVDIEGRTALSYAAGNKNVEVFKLFLSLPGADVKQRDERGMTLLMYAVRGGSVESVKLLLSLGANPNTRSRDGFSAADIAHNKPALANLFPTPAPKPSRPAAKKAPAKAARRKK